MDLDLGLGGLDVNAARLVHLEWELDLEDVVKNAPTSVTRQSHETCDVGRWIYGVALRKYGRGRDVWALKEVHKEFHAAAEDVVAARQDDDPVQAATAMDSVRRLSREIVFLLTRIELDTAYRRQASGLLGPSARALHAVTGSRAAAFPMLRDDHDAGGFWFFRRRKRRRADLLDVNMARLAHVQWTRDLQNSFRSHRSGPPVQSSAECELGIWISSVARRDYRDVPEFAELDAAHRRFHEASQRTIAALRRHNFLAADDAYEQVLSLSREIVYLLTRLERHLASTRSLARGVGSTI